MICIAYFTIVQLVVLIVFGDGVLGEMILSAIYIQYILGISGDLYALWYLHLCISSPSPNRWSGTDFPTCSFIVVILTFLLCMEPESVQRLYAMYCVAS